MLGRLRQIAGNSLTTTVRIVCPQALDCAGNERLDTMAAEFIGYSIVVTLRTPPGQVSGIVENVVNQQLILRDGQSYTSVRLERELTCYSLFELEWSAATTLYPGCEGNCRS